MEPNQGCPSNCQCIIYLKVDELAILPPERLPLPDHHSGHHLLAELGLPLLDGGQHHVPAAGSRQPRNTVISHLTSLLDKATPAQTLLLPCLLILTLLKVLHTLSLSLYNFTVL